MDATILADPHEAVRDLFDRRRLTVVAGPCVAESAELCLEVARVVQARCQARGLGFIFKASYDKANRTSLRSHRGPGLRAGLRMLSRVRETLGVPVITDVYDVSQVGPASEVADVLQIPAFLCRQTDLIVAAARTGKPVNIKKGQFLAPEDMRHVVAKHRESGSGPVAVTERGVSFGYQNLVVDMRALHVLRQVTGAPVIFDVTHALQRPGSEDGSTGGDRTLATLLVRAAAAAGIDGLFCEVHPTPATALSDGPNSLDFPLLEQVLDEVAAIDAVRRAFPRGPGA